MPRTEDLAEGLVILPSATDAVAGGGSSGQLSSPTATDARGRGEEEFARAVASLGWPGTGMTSATGSASSLPALRNDSGEAVWRLTEKALLHFEGCRVQLGPEGVRIRLGQCRGNAGCASGGTSKVEP
jgi:hypothetical protein